MNLLSLIIGMGAKRTPKHQAEIHLTETEMDILHAEQQQDYWNAIVPMLHARKARLIAQTQYNLLPELHVIRPKSRKTA